MQFTAALRERVASALRDFPLRSAPPEAQAHAAAVALVLLEEGTGAALPGFPRPAGWSREAAFLLTLRASALRRHAGQWALPGGRIDPGETPEAAALRELQEETGLVLAADAALGRLDDFVTISGFVITPVVFWGGSAPDLVPNPEEVESLHRIPLEELMRPDAPRFERITPQEEPMLRMPLGHGGVSPPTAALLYQFRELCLAGRTTRVAHLDQPLFARR